jgi:hypothetical protein
MVAREVLATRWSENCWKKTWEKNTVKWNGMTIASLG